MTLHADLVLQCLDLRGRPASLETTFDYDSADPYAVRLVFRGPSSSVDWLVSRNLLLNGLAGPTGDGDVRCWPDRDRSGRASVAMEFRSPGGRLVTRVQRAELERFLCRTLEVVPLGEERIDVDALLAGLLAESE